MATTEKLKPARREKSLEDWAKDIRAAWQKAVSSIILTGQTLIDAKAALDRHGEWMKIFDANRLPFGLSTAEKLMAIARNKTLAKSEHVRILPPSWGTLYELSRLDEDVLKLLIDKGKVTAEMEREDAIALMTGKSKEEAKAARTKKGETKTTPVGGVPTPAPAATTAEPQEAPVALDPKAVEAPHLFAKEMFTKEAGFVDLNQETDAIAKDIIQAVADEEKCRAIAASLIKYCDEGSKKIH